MHVNPAVALLARLLLGGFFLAAGLGKVGGFDGPSGYIASAGLPLPALLAGATIVLEVVGGLALIVGWNARWAALALALFTVAASVLFHAYWAMPAEQQHMQQLLFDKNLALTGGLLAIFALGAGGLSVDARRAAA